jgi:Flp pilus assembly protein TadD
VLVGRRHENAGRLGEARRAYEQAAEFRRRRYLSEDAEALQALAALCEREGDIEAARSAYARMARLPALAERAERELARLAG